MTYSPRGAGRKFRPEELAPYEGMTATQQAEALGCSISTIYYLRRDLRGGTALGRHRKFTLETFKPYRHLDRAAAASAMGCTPDMIDTLRAEAKAAGIWVKPPTPVLNPAVLDGLEGLTAKQQAASLGINVSTVWRLRRLRRGHKLTRPIVSISDLERLDGMTGPQQAEALGVSTATIYAARRRRREQS